MAGFEDAGRMLLLIDNYDSFVHNLARYFRQLGQTVAVARNDALTAKQLVADPPKAIVFSPGPGTPDGAGESLSIVSALSRRVPMLGVCLGHQTIAQACGGHIIRGDRPWHGRSSNVVHRQDGLFAGMPNPFVAGRYHSLVVDRARWPDELALTGWTDDGTVMAFQHRSLPLFGVQFHPESVLTAGGYQLLSNFLSLVGLNPTPVAHPEFSSNDVPPPSAPPVEDSRMRSDGATDAATGRRYGDSDDRRPGHPITF